MTFQKDTVDTQSDGLRADIAKFDTELTKHFNSQMSIAPFLSRKIVSFQGNKSKPAYNWYKYKEAYSAGPVEYFLTNTEGGTQGKVLDPFAGIGTTLFAATDRLEWWISSQLWKGYPERIPFSTFRITEGVYPSETVKSIERYRGAMHQESDKIQVILRLALLCVLESISYTRKDGQYLRWDARSGKIRRGTKPFDKGKILSFASAINTKLKEILSYITSHQTPITLFPILHTESDIRLFPGSCLKILPTLETASYTAIITSPPYCNRYDYTRTYALELAMLGLTHEDVCSLRQEMLSCTVENKKRIY